VLELIPCTEYLSQRAKNHIFEKLKIGHCNCAGIKYICLNIIYKFGEFHQKLNKLQQLEDEFKNKSENGIGRSRAKTIMVRHVWKSEAGFGGMRTASIIRTRNPWQAGISFSCRLWSFVGDRHRKGHQYSHRTLFGIAQCCAMLCNVVQLLQVSKLQTKQLCRDSTSCCVEIVPWSPMTLHGICLIRGSSICIPNTTRERETYFIC